MFKTKGKNVPYEFAKTHMEEEIKGFWSKKYIIFLKKLKIFRAKKYLSGKSKILGKKIFLEKIQIFVPKNIVLRKNGKLYIAFLRKMEVKSRIM